jgi:cytoskeletal protein CcmA (bactofilin family)
MNRLVTYLVVALVGVLATPGVADAQVYPERLSIAVKARRVVEATRAYQRRTRDDNREEQTERTTKVIRLGADGALALANIAGDILVTRGGGTDATIEIVKTARGRTAEDARELLTLVPVEVTERNGRAEVKTRYPTGEEQRRNNRRNINVSVAYTVTAPAGTRLSIDSISGSIKVADIKGDLNANSISGDVRISGAGRIGTAKSISGTIEISDTQADGAVAGSSVSGDVILRRVTARRLDGGSVSGNIKLDEVQCERVSAQTTSGSVWFSGALARSGRYELKSFSGEVRVMLSGNTGFEVDANSFSGEVRTDLAITTRGSNQPNRRGRHTTLSGTYGDGAAILDLTTFSGSIVISKR